MRGTSSSVYPMFTSQIDAIHEAFVGGKLVTKAPSETSDEPESNKNKNSILAQIMTRFFRFTKTPTITAATNTIAIHANVIDTKNKGPLVGLLFTSRGYVGGINSDSILSIFSDTHLQTASLGLFSSFI